MHIPNFKSISQKTAEKVWKSKFKQRAITPVTSVWGSLNFIIDHRLESVDAFDAILSLN